ncbi:PREDICTED: coiled-coil domain-containing protein 61-like isoform X2 [Priapulus caudatus]|uniref:Centrosomal protein CCDC61 n=1 Tax=Priapulus caudatus TaxID=37621 RepID=A0ABM1DRR3_PRICU|nr:PREDICTED: coiled-coil domain-containing protein 61-like isoform X2 [Priapulus caudatus]
MEGEISVISTCLFRGSEYVVSMVTSGSSAVPTLEIQVEHHDSGQRWEGAFGVSYIEDMTHKTGNFKQFNIFVSMLESALVKNTDSVTLDLLTHADLETLRSRKVTVQSQGSSTRSVTKNKRYLILTYTVEFDRIHYPLPLTYQGNADPKRLQKTVQSLRTELKDLRQRHAAASALETDLRKLQRDYDALLVEKEDLEVAYEELRLAAPPSYASVGLGKEERLLKEMIKMLEEELMRERTKHQRVSAKKDEECRELQAEVKDLRGKERSLQIHVKNLTKELAEYKRGRLFTPRLGASSTTSNSMRRSESYTGQQSVAWARERTLSRLYQQRKTPSPAPRFDPTAYVKSKERQLKSSTQRRKRSLSRGSCERSGFLRGASPCVGSGARTRSHPISRSPSPAYSQRRSVAWKNSNTSSHQRRSGSLASRSSSCESSRNRQEDRPRSRQNGPILNSPSVITQVSSLKNPYNGRSKSATLTQAKNLKVTKRPSLHTPSATGDSRSLRRSSGNPVRRSADRARSSLGMNHSGSSTRGVLGPQPDIAELDARLQALQDYLRDAGCTDGTVN